MFSKLSRRCVLFLAAIISCANAAMPSATAAEWQAAAVKTPITPKQPMWMSGYGFRDRPSEGTDHELWCKALALQSPQGQKAVLITLDVCGISRSVGETACSRIKEQTGLDRAQVMIACSHTHSGPLVENNLDTMFDLSEEETAKVASYTRELENTIVDSAAKALKQLKPARIAWGTGYASFAVNRRNNPEAKVPELRPRGELRGPVDYDVPVLSIRDSEGTLQSVVFGYACHATALSFYRWNGDYPGYAQIELEKTYPNAVALFFAGCAGDQNPVPRRTIEHAEQHGRHLADAVRTVLNGTMKPIADSLEARFALLELPFDTLPTKEELEARLGGSNQYEARRAKHLLKQIERDGKLSPTYPYPIQVWQIGKRGDENSLLWIALGGEVTVGYSLRLKKELWPGQTWVAAYANDVMGYIPTRRVWDEGGYEGVSAMVYYGLPTRWTGSVEDLIVKKVHEVVPGAKSDN